MALRSLLALALLAGVRQEEPGWKDISAPVLKRLKDEERKVAWPGGTAGVVVDPSSGAVYMIVPGQGLWRSEDRGATFARVDGGKVGGRCETAFSLQVDPGGGRLACFMLDGPCAMTADAGKTWNAFTGLGRNFDYAAVDWSERPVRRIFAARHETGGEVYLSLDAGVTWTRLFADREFETSGGLGIFDDGTLVYTMKGRGIQRSTDSGKTWSRISDVEPRGRVIRIRKGTAHWLGREGILVSRDRGATWARWGAPVDASIGPLFDPKDDGHLAVAGAKGIFETRDGAKSWTRVAALPEKFNVPKPGWFSNVAWDPARRLFYVSRMGRPTFRLAANP